MHDIGQIKSCKNHSKVAKPVIKGLLKDTNLSPEEIEKVLKTIETHMEKDCRKLKKIEEKILHDADELDHIGVVGIIRAFIYGSNIGRSMEGTVNYVESKMNEYEKKVKGMCFPFSKKLAEKRIKNMKIVLRMIKDELKIKE